MNDFHENYIRAAIDGEVGRLAASQEGERNNNLFKATAALAGLGLREGEILDHLKPVAEQIGLRGRELYSTVKSGMKSASTRNRSRQNGIPSASRNSPSIANRLPHRLMPDAKGHPIFFVGGEEGPRLASDEVRRHVYRRNGKPVRVKIKRAAGYSNWYLVAVNHVEGWQPAKPDSYKAVPYVGAIDPFDPELSNDFLYWPEGEKDCDTLGSVHLPAMTFGGAGDGLPDGIAEYLRGRHIVILADNDAAGREHAQKKAVVAYTAAASVRLMEFPELPAKGDVTDYLQNATADDLEQRARDTEPWSPPITATAAGTWRSSLISARELAVQTFKPVSYVLPGYIPEGVTLFVGKPKIGKSWLVLDVCVASAGGRFVLGTIRPAQGDVLYLALEDSPRRLKNRLEKICPKDSIPDRLSFVTEWRRADAGGVEDIAAWCDTVANPLLVIIDTLERFRPATKQGSWQYSNDYAAISSLQSLANERRLAIVVIHHVRKMDAEDPFDMISGTNGLSGAADTMLVLKRQAGSITLHARGRDIEETATACEFNKSTCRWTLIGEADEVRGSAERAAVLDALGHADADGMSIPEILVATGRRDRNALDQLLFKMLRDGEVEKPKRGLYVASKIGKKERSDNHLAE